MWYNGVMLWLLRSPLHGAISRDVLAVTYTGRKSGQRYSVPVNYVRDGERLLITSTPARTWWRNLRGGQRVSLRLRGKETPAVGHVIEAGEALAEALAAYFRGAPQMARYFDVKMIDGEPDPVDLARVAPSRVMIVLEVE